MDEKDKTRKASDRAKLIANAHEFEFLVVLREQGGRRCFYCTLLPAKLHVCECVIASD